MEFTNEERLNMLFAVENMIERYQRFLSPENVVVLDDSLIGRFEKKLHTFLSLKEKLMSII